MTYTRVEHQPLLSGASHGAVIKKLPRLIQCVPRNRDKLDDDPQAIQLS